MAHLEVQRVGGEMHYYATFDNSDDEIGFGDRTLRVIVQRLDEHDQYEVTEAVKLFSHAETSDDAVLSFDVDEIVAGCGVGNVVVSTDEGSQFIGSFFCLMEGGINQRLMGTAAA